MLISSRVPSEVREAKLETAADQHPEVMGEVALHGDVVDGFLGHASVLRDGGQGDIEVNAALGNGFAG